MSCECWRSDSAPTVSSWQSVTGNAPTTEQVLNACHAASLHRFDKPRLASSHPSRVMPNNAHDKSAARCKRIP